MQKVGLVAIFLSIVFNCDCQTYPYYHDIMCVQARESTLLSAGSNDSITLALASAFQNNPDHNGGPWGLSYYNRQKETPIDGYNYYLDGRVEPNNTGYNSQHLLGQDAYWGQSTNYTMSNGPKIIICNSNNDSRSGLNNSPEIPNHIDLAEVLTYNNEDKCLTFTLQTKAVNCFAATAFQQQMQEPDWQQLQSDDAQFAQLCSGNDNAKVFALLIYALFKNNWDMLHGLNSFIHTYTHYCMPDESIVLPVNAFNFVVTNGRDIFAYSGPFCIDNSMEGDLSCYKEQYPLHYALANDKCLSTVCSTPYTGLGLDWIAMHYDELLYVPESGRVITFDSFSNCGFSPQQDEKVIFNRQVRIKAGAETSLARQYEWEGIPLQQVSPITAMPYVGYTFLYPTPATIWDGIQQYNLGADGCGAVLDPESNNNQFLVSGDEGATWSYVDGINCDNYATFTSTKCYKFMYKPEEETRNTLMAFSGCLDINTPMEAQGTGHTAWVTYTRLNSQSAYEALSSVWDKVLSIRTSDWAFIKNNARSLANNTPTGLAYKHAMEYGKGYEIVFSEPTNFCWDNCFLPEATLPSVAKSNFCVVEKPEYTIVDVVGLSDRLGIEDIVLYADNDCVAAGKVIDGAAQLLVYGDGHEGEMLQIMTYPQERAMSNYEIYDANDNCWCNQTLVAGASSYSLLRLTTPTNNTTSTPLTHVCAFPNPANPDATIGFYLAKAATVETSIYDVKGRIVQSFSSGNMQPGFQNLLWHGNNQNGDSVPSGLYFYRVKAGGCQVTGKLTIIK